MGRRPGDKEKTAEIATMIDRLWRKPAGTTMQVLSRWCEVLPHHDTLRVAQALLEDALEFAPLGSRTAA